MYMYMMYMSIKIYQKRQVSRGTCVKIQEHMLHDTYYVVTRLARRELMCVQREVT